MSADKQWTVEQLDAINAHGGSVVVSAAAGSGKTAVLVERIISKITDQENPVDADRLLVATFSRAAATEMVERIGQRLSSLIAKDRNNKFLQRQQTLLAKANISTIHSFCLNLLKENSELLDIDSAFRLADESELSVIAADALDEVMQNGYNSEDKEFLRLSDVFSKRDDTPLQEMIVSIYSFIRSFPFPKEWLRDALKVYENTDIDKCDWKDILTTEAYSYLTYLSEKMHFLAEKVSQTELSEFYLQTFLDDANRIKDLSKDILSCSWDEIVTNLSFINFQRIPTAKGVQDDQLKKYFQKQRNDIIKKIKDDSGDLKSKFFCSTKEEFKQDADYLYPLIKRLFEAVTEYYDKLDELKKDRSIVDYADLELFTIKLLSEYDGEKHIQSDVAKRLSEQFDEILLDEYQDTNAAQDMIFELLSKNGTGENIFVVGDVKQSIYGFRKAMPEIFNKRKNDATEYNGKEFPALINLSANFRSRENVTGFINFVFKQIMSKNVGNVLYDERELLNPQGSFIESINTQTEIHIINTQDLEKKEQKNAEAEHIAETIFNMISSGHLVQDKDGKMRPCRGQDFCILLRSKKNTQKFVKAMQSFGISSLAENNTGYFDRSEISVMINLIKVIDNPLEDIALLSVLMSPAFAFTPDDLADIRATAPKADLYVALGNYAKTNEHAKEFIDTISRLRALSAVTNVSELIRNIYDTTDIFVVAGAMSAGELRQANLRLLYDYAFQYDKTGSGGLSGYVRYLDRLISNGDDFTGVNMTVSSPDVVQIMTIHHSKGLEFPICILAECSRKFNMDDTRGKALIHRSFGYSTKVIIPEKLRNYPTAFHNALSVVIANDCISEEMRILYVALTRAKEKLIISCTINNDDVLNNINKVNLKSEKIFDGAVKSVKCFADWILMAVLRHPDASELRAQANCHAMPIDDDSELIIKILKHTSSETQKTEESSVNTQLVDMNIVDRLIAEERYGYPYEGATKCVSKLAVTQLAEKTDRADFRIKARPDFVEKDGITPAERGTITHKFLQFADFENSISNLDEEINRLYEAEFLAEYEVKALNKTKLKAFFNSELMKRIVNADEVFREYGFFDEIPAQEIYEDDDFIGDEKVLVQGIADCVIIENGVATVVDYKTDYVKTPEELVERYRKQLEIYARAIKKSFEIKDCKILIYSLHLEKEIIL